MYSVYTFLLSELMILREKSFADFFLVSMEYRKNKSFQKVLKKCHTGELHKKGTILGAANHTFF